MKVLCITHKYPPQTGGMEKQSYELITGLREHAEVIALTYHGQCNKLRWILGLRKRIRAILKEHGDIAIIHLNDGLMATLCIWLKTYTSIPITVTLHGLDITYPWSIYRNIVVPRLKQLDLVITVSDATRQVCLDLGFDGDRVVTVVNGVDHDLLSMHTPPDIDNTIDALLGQPLGNRKLLVGLGRAVKRKGFSWFANEVVPLLPSDIVFAVIGPYEDKPSITTRILGILPQKFKHHMELLLGHMTDSAALVKAASDSNGGIVQFGRLDFSVLMGVLSRADLFVMPNVNIYGDAEGFGLVALEASLRQTAVLAADLEGITSAIHHKSNGWLIPSEDPHAWSKAITHLLNNPDERSALATTGAQYTVDSFGWRKMATQYHTALAQVVSNRS